MSSAADPSMPGDYVAPGVSTPPAALGFSAADGLRTRSLYVEAVRRSDAVGTERILVRLDPDGPGPMDWTDLDAVRVTVLDVALVPDYNRDGKIDDADRDKAASGETFRFWINDDKDVGDVAVDDSDVPGKSNGNCADDVVNGHCDLLDFFPVWLDLKHILAALPPGNGVTYRMRCRGLKFVYTALTNERAGSCLREACDTCGARLNRKAFEAPTLPAGDAERESVIDLSSTFLSAVQVDGNMVVSSAIADHNMAVSKYMMCDAAVVSEAYDSTMAKTDDLVHPMCADHDRRTWAANWHELFSGTHDSRRMLTWRNRLRPVVARTEVTFKWR